MREKLPKDCTSLMHKLAKAFSDNDNAILGFKTELRASSSNKFTLVINRNPPEHDLIKNVYLIECSVYDNVIVHDINITVPSINSMFEKLHPDICLKPRTFIPIKKLCDEYHLNESDIAKEIFNRLKHFYNTNKKWNEVINFSCRSICNYDNVIKTVPISSFSEFLIWIDLNG